MQYPDNIRNSVRSSIELPPVTEECTVKNFLYANGVSHRLLVKLKRTENGITVNGAFCRSCDILCKGDIVRLTLPLDEKTEMANPLLKVPVIYEDEDFVIYDKPWGMPVHPSAGHRTDTLGNCFAAMYPGLAFRPVNRLDRDTSGLCLCAKNSRAANIPANHIAKTYYCAAEGIIASAGTINAPIARENGSAVKRTVCADGRCAVTHYTPIFHSCIHTLLEVRLETGRTHQIRVHFSHIGHPLAGDDLYGGSREHILRQALHCGAMSLTSPLTSSVISVKSPLPEDISALFEQSGNTKI